MSEKSKIEEEKRRGRREERSSSPSSQTLPKTKLIKDLTTTKNKTKTTEETGRGASRESEGVTIRFES